MALYIGGIFRGPELERSRIYKVIGALTLAKDSAQPQVVNPTDGELDLVYHVPGSLFKVDFQGIRTGRISKKERIMQVQMAVPEAALNAPNLLSILTDLLRQAVKVGSERLAKKEISFSQEDHLRLIDQIEALVAKQLISPSGEPDRKG
jgi:hypothetical protein